ncbi:MAG: hypothetical protein ACFFG0_36675 [Candidatus Thorarchaeota archaeon]
MRPLKYYNCEYCGEPLINPDRRKKFCNAKCRVASYKRDGKGVFYERLNVIEDIGEEDCNCGICQNKRYNALLIKVARYFFQKGISEAIREDAPIPFEEYWNEYEIIKNNV